jgi:hypothetical protein
MGDDRRAPQAQAQAQAQEEHAYRVTLARETAP